MLGFQRVEKLEIDTQGDLVLHTVVGPIHQRKPVIYQEVDGVRKEIPGGYVLKGEHQVSFKVAAYDASQPLVIDPVLFYSTYLGGNALDAGFGIAVDAVGNAYVTGFAVSTNFPTTVGAFQTTSGGGDDAFGTKLNPTGSAPLVYSTYLGGSAEDSCGGGGGGGGAGDKRLMPPGALAERRLVFRVRSPEPHAKRLTRDFRRLLYECHTRTAIYL